MNLDESGSRYWNEKYLNKECTWDIGKPTPIFIDQEKTFKRKSTILIPGCGLGHDAIYFAKNHHKVDALDFSKYAINYISFISKKNNIQINTIEADFFNLTNLYNNKYDYIIEYTFFCAITPDKRLIYAKKCYDLLKSDGMLKGIFLPLKKDTANNPPYHVSIDNIKDTFNDFFNITKINLKINSVPQRLNNEIYVEMVKK